MFREFEIKNFQGMASNIATPKKEQCILNKNLDVHEKPGTLTLRPGYGLEYGAPTFIEIQNQEFVSFDNFYDKTANPDGQEITVNIIKGTVGIKITDEVFFVIDQDLAVSLDFTLIATTGIVVTSVGGGTTYVEDVDYTINHAAGEITAILLGGMSGSTNYEISYVSAEETQNQLNFFVRPYWSGSAWTDAWQWLNETVITKVTTATDGTDATMIKVLGYQADDYFVGWTMWNKTQNIVSQVITSKQDTTTTRINHTLYNSGYAVDDIIYLFKNYINPTLLQEMYNATSSEVVYHKVLNDMRIGFGGKENRVGVSIGYRSKYFKIKAFDFTNVHSDLDNDALIAFSTINELVLDEYSFIQKPYGIDLTAIGGSLDAGTYMFKLTGLLDDNSEILLAENEIAISASEDIEIRPYILLGEHNKRITDFKVYYSTDDGLTYHKFGGYEVSTPEASGLSYNIDDDGKLILDNVNVELYGGQNAASEADIDSIGTWQQENGGAISTAGGATSAYSLEFQDGVSPPRYFDFISGIINGKSYDVSVDVATDTTATSAQFYFANSADTNTPLSNNKVFNGTSSFVTQSETLIPTSDDVDVLVFKMWAGGGSHVLYIDILSIRGDAALYTSSTTPGTEISAEMGYTPTFNLVKDWEQCLVFNGRGHFLNPFIDQEYDNFIFKSAISSGWMYDAVPASIFNELDKFDGSKTVGMALLPNSDLLILKDQSVMIIDPDTNFTRDFGRGKGCIARESIVTLTNSIIWCGLEDIYTISPSGGLIVTGILDDSIRDLYLADDNLTGIVAVRNKYDLYRFRFNGTSNDKEYLLTDRSWIQEIKNTHPNMYRVGHDNKVWFAADAIGDLYIIGDAVKDYQTNIPIARDSIKFNPNLMGEQITANMRLYLGYLFIKYESSEDFTITLNYRRVNVDATVKTLSYTVDKDENFFKQKLPPNITVNEFWLSISGSISATFESESMGVLWDKVPVGMG